MDQAQNTNQETIPAIVQAVRFENAESGYTIFFAYPEESKFPKRDRFTAVGNVGSLRERERVILKGVWIEHKKFGLQFEVQEMELPDFSGDSILGFLTSGYLKGVGKALALRIYEKFGEQTSNVLDDSPEDLLQVRGIGKKKLKDVIHAWQENRGKKEALGVFSKMGLGPMTIQKVLKRWQNPRDAIQTVQGNPYLLAWEIQGVGFLQADRIARNLNFDLKHPLRVQASIGFALKQAEQNDGHCYLTREQLFMAVNKLLNPEMPDTSAFDAADVRLIEDNLSTLLFKNIVVEEQQRIYRVNVYRAEQELAEGLKRLLSGQGGWKTDLGQRLNQYQQDNNVSLHHHQADAVISSLVNKVGIVTGGPGTGKTTIIRALITLASEYIDPSRIKLAAPTGRAAKRMSESTGLPACTVHRLLDFAPSAGGFNYNKDKPLPADLVIVDESSMLDVFLARSLVVALHMNCRIILVGDINQLPSVGAGNVLNDMMRSGRVPVARLTKIFRQSNSQDSYICKNAEKVNEGKAKELVLDNSLAEDFKWWGIEDAIHEGAEPAEKSEIILRRIIASTKRLLNLGFAPQDIQVLSPMFKGAIGVKELNIQLQNLFNPTEKRVKIGMWEFSAGDRVMQCKNNYDLDTFNGDQGYIQDIDENESIVLIEFEGRLVQYEFADMDEVSLAYAITVHKSQGAESPAIIQPVSISHWVMLQRNLLYTGITRAKKMCVLVGERKALDRAVRRNSTVKRNTALSRKIRYFE